MRNVIRVQPATELRREFAAWAVDQQPKIRTVGSHEFGVPPHLYTHMPEELLIGALVEGTLYVPALDDVDDGVTAEPAELASGGLISTGLLIAVGEGGPPFIELPFGAEATSVVLVGEAGPRTVLDRRSLDSDRAEALARAVTPPPQQEPEPTSEASGEPEAGWREAVPGRPLPPVPDSAYGTDAVPIPPPPAEDEQSQDGSFACGEPSCRRTFGTARGRDTHARKVHPETRTGS